MKSISPSTNHLSPVSIQTLFGLDPASSSSSISLPIKFTSFQFGQQDVMGYCVKSLTEVQINDISVFPLSIEYEDPADDSQYPSQH